MSVLTVSNVAVVEGNSGSSSLVFTITLSAPVNVPVTFSWFLQDGSGGDGTNDYFANSGSVTIPANTTSVTISAFIVGDLIDELDESFQLILTTLQNATFAGGGVAYAATGTIIDNDVQPPSGSGGTGALGSSIFGPASASSVVPTVNISNVSVFEGNSGSTPIRFLVTLSSAPTAPLTFSYVIQGGSGRADVDFSEDSGTITFQAGQSSGWITTFVSSDTVLEGNETIQLIAHSISNGVFAGGAPALIATGTIIDNDGGGSGSGGIGAAAIQATAPASASGTLPTVSVANVSMIEGNVGSDRLNFLIVLDRAPTAPVTLRYNAVDGSASDANFDFNRDSGTLTIQAGQTSTVLSIFVSGDTLVESNETVQLILSEINGAVFAGNAPALIATGTIVDNDGPTQLGVGGVGGFGSAVASAASASATLPTLTVFNTAVTEGSNFSTQAAFVLTLDRAPTAPVTVRYYYSDGTTGEQGGDVDSGSGIATFGVGERSLVIPMSVFGDSIIEANETFQLVLFGIEGGVFSGGASSMVATGTILENDAGPIVGTGGLGRAGLEMFAAPSASSTLPTISVRDVAILEGSGGSETARFVVTLDRPSAVDVTVRFQVHDGTASANRGDFDDGWQTLTIPAGWTSSTISTFIYGDTEIEGNETFQLTLTQATNAVFANNAPALVATGTIIDDDSASITRIGGVGQFGDAVVGPADVNSLPTARIVSSSVIEGSGGSSGAGVYVLLSRAPTSNVTVSYSTASGTATSGGDFFSSSGTLTILAGQRSAFIPISVSGDTVIESDEIFAVNFSSLTNAVFETGGTSASVNVLIRDDDSGTLSGAGGIAFTSLQIDRADGSIDGNMTSDILLRNTAGVMQLWSMNGATATQSGAFVVSDPSYSAVGTGDFNGDGRYDVLFRNSGGILVQWALEGPQVTDTNVYLTDPAWTISGIGDFNGDGRDDILFRGPSGLLAQWQMNGTTVQSVGVFAQSDPTWAVAAVADFNGDGRDDILWRNSSGLLANWTMNGFGVSSAGVIAASDPAWQIVGTGDFNGDLREDILWRSPGGVLAQWQMNGGTATAVGTFAVSDPNWQVSDIGDYNGDGRDDILWQGPDGTFAVWTMNGFVVLGTGIAGNPGAGWGDVI